MVDRQPVAHPANHRKGCPSPMAWPSSTSAPAYGLRDAVATRRRRQTASQPRNSTPWPKPSPGRGTRSMPPTRSQNCAGARRAASNGTTSTMNAASSASAATTGKARSPTPKPRVAAAPVPMVPKLAEILREHRSQMPATTTPAWLWLGFPHAKRDPPQGNSTRPRNPPSPRRRRHRRAPDPARPTPNLQRPRPQSSCCPSRPVDRRPRHRDHDRALLGHRHRRKNKPCKPRCSAWSTARRSPRAKTDHEAIDDRANLEPGLEPDRDPEQKKSLQPEHLRKIGTRSRSGPRKSRIIPRKWQKGAQPRPLDQEA